jgi:hypothetical protein
VFEVWSTFDRHIDWPLLQGCKIKMILIAINLHVLFLKQRSNWHFYRHSSCSFQRFICLLQLNTQIYTYVNAPDTTLTRFTCQWGSSCRRTFGKQILVVKEINRLLHWFQWMNFEQSTSIKHANDSTNIYVHRFILMNHACSMQSHVHDRNKQRKKVFFLDAKLLFERNQSWEQFIETPD